MTKSVDCTFWINIIFHQDCSLLSVNVYISLILILVKCTLMHTTIIYATS